MDPTDKTMDSKDTDTLQRKHPFDNLSKDELVKKCKHFLMLAQKAKQAKDDATEEIKRLKEELTKYEGTPEMKPKETIRQSDTSSMQEMIDTLTEQKLSLVIEMDKVLKQSAAVERQLDQVRQDERKARQQVNQLTTHLQELETSLENAHTQIKHLTLENDDLLQQLDTAELELRSLRDRGIERNESIKFKQKITAVENEMTILQEELDRVTEENRKKNEQMKQLHEQFTKEKLLYEEQFKQKEISWEERICELNDQLQKERSTFELTLKHERESFERKLKQEGLAWQNSFQEFEDKVSLDKKKIEENTKMLTMSLQEQFSTEKLNIEDNYKQQLKNREQQFASDVKAIEDSFKEKLRSYEETIANEKQLCAENFEQNLLACEKHYKQEIKARDEKYMLKLKKAEEKFCEELRLMEAKFSEEKNILEEEISKMQEKYVEDKRYLENRYNNELLEQGKKFEQEKNALVEKFSKEKQSLEEKLHREKSLLEEKYHKEIESINEARTNVKDANLEIEKLTREIQNLFEEKQQFATHVHKLKETLKYTNAEKDAYFQVKERLKHDNESLLDQLKALMNEKDKVVSGIENVKQNNAELNRLIQDLGAERESFIKEVAKLNMEKKNLMEQLDIIGANNSAAMEQNCFLKSEVHNLKELLEKVTAEKILMSEDNTYLKSEKKKLSELLETVSVEKIVISEENACLKSEKGKLEESLDAAQKDRVSLLDDIACLKAEKEKLNSELLKVKEECVDLQLENTNAKTRLYNILQNNFQTIDTSGANIGISEIEPVDDSSIKQFTSLSDIITNLDETIEKFCSVTRTNGSSVNVSDYSESKEVTESDSQETRESALQVSVQVHGSDVSVSEAESSVENEQTRDEVQRLCSELEHLNVIISNMESHGEKLQAENDKLKEEISRIICLLPTCSYKEERNLEEEKETNDMMQSSYSSSKLFQKLEAGVGELDIKRIFEIFETNEQRLEEIEQLRKEIVYLSELKSRKDSNSEEELRKEFQDCKENLSIKSAQLKTLQEELNSFFGKQVFHAGEDVSVETLRKEFLEKDQMLEENIDELKQLRKIKVDMDIKAKEYDKLCSELLFIQDVLKDKEREFNILKERLENGEEKYKSEINFLQKKLSESENLLKTRNDDIEPIGAKKVDSNEAGMNKVVRDLKTELLEKSTIIETSRTEILNLCEETNMLKHERDKLEDEINHLKSQIDSNNSELSTLKEVFFDWKQQSLECLLRLQQCFIVSDSCEGTIDDKFVHFEPTKEQLQQVIAATDILIAEIKKLQSELRNTNEALGLKTEEAQELKELCNCLQEKNSALLSDISRLHEDCEKLKLQLDQKLIEVNALKADLDEHIRFEKDLKENLNKVTEECQSKNKVLDELNAELHMLKTSASDVLSKLGLDFNSEQNSLESTHKLASQQIEDMSRKLQEANIKLKYQTEELENKVSLLEEEKRAKGLLNERLVEIARVTQQLSCSYTDLTAHAIQFKTVLREQVDYAASTLHAVVDQLAQSQAVESAGILHDMNEMNQALKLRGETISKLQEAVGDLEHQLRDAVNHLEVTQKELQTSISSLDDREAKVQSLEAEVARQQEEMTHMRTRLAELEKDAYGDAAPSEVMSNSTISKSEDQSRLKDLEDTFEERYTKLRTVAVRLKKRVSELTAHQTLLETERNKLIADKAELQACVTQMSTQAKNLQSLQLEYDKLQDTLEIQKTEISQMKKSHISSTEEYNRLKKDFEECREEKEKAEILVEKFRKEKILLEKTQKDLFGQLKNLKKEKEAQNATIKEQEILLTNLREDVKAVQQKLSDEIEHHCATREALEISSQECKKSSLLTLEMDDYERRVSELTQQLEKEKAKVVELQNHIAMQSNIVDALKEQINHLEKCLVTEEARSKEAKDQANMFRQRLSEIDVVVADKDVSLQEVKMEVENLRGELETLQLHLAKTAAEKQRTEDVSHKQQCLLTEKISILEQQLAEMRLEKDKYASDLAEVQAEFENYKVRATSVLRQKVRTDEQLSFVGVGAEEEIAQLRRTNDIMKQKLQETNMQVSILEQELSACRQERTKALDRVQELTNTTNFLQQQVEQLREQARTVTVHHADTLREHKLQADTLILCYKKQIEELEERFSLETSNLKQQLEVAEEQLQHVRKTAKEDGETLRNVSEGSSFTPVKVQTIEISLLEREDGEGSENVDSLSPHSNVQRDQHQEPVPLARLLASPIDVDNENTLEDTGKTGIQKQICPEEELREAQRQLAAAEAYSRHLSSLLSEAERELALSQQQAQLLKEELRRNQRSVEREQHAHNLEYLKNVIIKFLTLQGGDERSRLVPVLNTILKLSPEETDQLNTVAKGGADVLAGSRGWGSYLPLWPSH